MLPCLTEHWGNPSSAYDLANAPARMIAEAREHVAKLIGADPRNIVFTSCGTESNNAVIQSALQCNPTKQHVITSAVEHVAVLETVRYIEREHGFDATVLPVDATGMVSAADVAAAVRPSTVIVSVMHANNEVGTLNPIAEIVAAAKAANPATLVHCDASQSLGKVPVDVDKFGVDYLTVAGHKLYAPKV